jgi:hypothetical protein
MSLCAGVTKTVLGSSGELVKPAAITQNDCGGGAIIETIDPATMKVLRDEIEDLRTRFGGRKK